MRIVRFVALMAVVTFGLAAPAAAQTTGQILGLITDAAGKGVADVVITVSSPQSVGTSTVHTDASGHYGVFALPPGTYTLQTALTGFQTTTQSGVVVRLGQSVVANFKLVAGEPGAPAAASSSTAGAVDLRSPARVMAVSGDALEALPAPRDLTSLLRLTPFAPVDEAMVNNLRRAPWSFDTPGLVPEFVAAAAITDGAVAPEFRADRRIDAITRTGSNALRGTLFGFGTGQGLTAKNTAERSFSVTTTTVESLKRAFDFGGAVGGALAKDKAWFFVGYDEARQREDSEVVQAVTGGPALGSKIPTDVSHHVFAGNVTWSPANGQRLVGSATGDPTTTDGRLFRMAGPASTWQGTLDNGGYDASVRYQAAIGGGSLLEAAYGRRSDKATYAGPGTSSSVIVDQTQIIVPASGGFSFFQNRDLKRDQAFVGLSSSLHAHAIKAGLDYDRLDGLVTSFSGGGGQRIDQRLTADGLLFYQHRFYDPTRGTVAPSWISDPVSTDTAFYAQDTWTVESHLTVLGGIRWNRQNVSAGGGSVLSISNNLAGRLGVVFAPKNGKSKFTGHAGRFYDALPLDLAMRAAGGESWCVCTNFSSTGVAAPPLSIPLPGAAHFGGATRVDSDLRGQFSDEYAIGYERELAPTVLVSGRYTYRRLGRLIEDMRGPNGEFLIVNPSFGTLGQTMLFMDGSTLPTPKPRRVSHRVEGSVRRSFADGWQLMATYGWSKTDGNYDGPEISTVDSSEMNLRPAYDYADFLVNATGRSSADRPHTAKIDATYTIHAESRLNGLTAGVSMLAASGTPLNVYGYSLTYQNWNYLLLPRGTEDRNPAVRALDLHVAYPLHMGKRATAEVTGDLFNVTNRQVPTTIDQRYNLSSNPACAAIPSAICNGDGGLLHDGASLKPVDTLFGLAASLNPDLLYFGVRFPPPFSARLGVRLRF